MSKEEGGSDMATGKERQGGASGWSWWPAKVHICSLSNPVPPLAWQVTKGVRASTGGWMRNAPPAVREGPSAQPSPGRVPQGLPETGFTADASKQQGAAWDEAKLNNRKEWYTSRQCR